MKIITGIRNVLGTGALTGLLCLGVSTLSTNGQGEKNDSENNVSTTELPYKIGLTTAALIGGTIVAEAVRRRQKMNKELNEKEQAEAGKMQVLSHLAKRRTVLIELKNMHQNVVLTIKNHELKDLENSYNTWKQNEKNNANFDFIQKNNASAKSEIIPKSYSAYVQHIKSVEDKMVKARKKIIAYERVIESYNKKLEANREEIMKILSEDDEESIKQYITGLENKYPVLQQEPINIDLSDKTETVNSLNKSTDTSAQTDKEK